MPNLDGKKAVASESALSSEDRFCSLMWCSISFEQKQNSKMSFAFLDHWSWFSLFFVFSVFFSFAKLYSNMFSGAFMMLSNQKQKRKLVFFASEILCSTKSWSNTSLFKSQSYLPLQSAVFLYRNSPSCVLLLLVFSIV